MRRYVVLAVALSSAIAVADDDLNNLPAAAQDQANKLAPEARPHFVAGYRAFVAKDYKTASAEFELAYKSSPEVPLLYTWAQSERLGHNCSKAITLYEKYLYADINQEQTQYARRWIRECEAELDKTRVPNAGSGANTADNSGNTGSGANTAGNGANTGTATNGAGTNADGGAGSGGAGSGAGSGGPADTSYVFYTDYTGDVLVGGGVIGLVVGALYFSKASGDADASDSKKHPELTLEMYNQLRDDAIHERNVGTAATILGGVLAAAGIGVYIYHWKTHAPVTVATDGRTISLATRF